MKKNGRVIFISSLLMMLTVSCGILFSTYTLTVKVEDDLGGEVLISPEKDEYSEGTEVELIAIADTGYIFDHWEGVDEEDESTAALTMEAHRIVTASFIPDISRSNPTDGLINAPATSFSPSADDKWTFLVYLDGDNNLEPYALLDFNEMEEGLLDSGNTGNMEIIVLFDRRDGGTGDTEWKDSRYYRILPDNTETIESELLDDTLGELAMSDPDTLANFIAYGTSNYPADHYALMLWNHGGGARSLTESTTSRQICEDESTPGDYLFLDEVQQALTGSTAMDVISIDACLMGTVETAYEFRNLASYFIASMGDVNANGWDYKEFFGRMDSPSTTSGSVDALPLAMVDAFRWSTLDYTDQTISAVNLEKMEPLKTAIDELAVELYGLGQQALIENMRDSSLHFFSDNYTGEALANPYYDLNDLCYRLIENEEFLSAAVVTAAESIIQCLDDAVVSAYGGNDMGNYYGLGSEVKRGLSIFFSKGDEYYENLSHYSYQYWYTAQDASSGDYGYIDFCTSDSDGVVESWRELMEVWYDPYRSPVGFTPGSW